MRQRLGSLASRLYPGLDEAVFNRKQDAIVRDAVREGAYGERLARFPMHAAFGRTVDRPARIVIVPQFEAAGPSWQPAGGSFLFEIAQAAREYAGDDAVSVFEVGRDEEPREWHVRLIEFLLDTGATHLLAQIEADPYRTAERWTWDTFWSQLHPRWDGAFLGLTFDSSWKWLAAQSRRLARMSPQFLLVDICMPMDGELVPGRPEVGPVNMPVSRAALARIDEYNAGVAQDIHVSFIGALYPDRVEMIEQLRAVGVDVAVNPHRPDATTNLAESRAALPSYLDYMRGLARSRMTINLSKSSAGDFTQLKTRVLEAAAVGCLVLTDDVDRTSRFWQEGVDYAHFSTPEELASIVADFLADPDRLAAAQASGRARAREIAVTSFWGGIDAGLAARDLPAILA